ncbi:hypothetical protein BC830DRAFT_1165896 [Chytriomyces sp. MP71]|nr:hypothetical protein BC830DRAFT_1165896 [Chytriomyces sp. MP71]
MVKDDVKCGREGFEPRADLELVARATCALALLVVFLAREADPELEGVDVGMDILAGIGVHGAGFGAMKQESMQKTTMLTLMTARSRVILPVTS